jgi:transposase
MANSAIARTLSISRPTILLWKNRFKVKGVTGLMEIEEGRGKKPVVSTKKIEAIIEDTLHTKPADADVWTTRTLAHKHGVSHDFVKKVWQANNLKPWW